LARKPRLPALEPSPSTLSDPTAVPEADERHMRSTSLVIPKTV